MIARRAFLRLLALLALARPSSAKAKPAEPGVRIKPLSLSALRRPHKLAG